MDINHDLGSIFSDALTEVISTISSFSVKLLSQEKDNDFEDITGIMSLNGEKIGTFFVSAKELDMRLLCSYMIGVHRAEVTKDDIEDIVCELVNMTAGSVRLRLAGTDYAFDLSQPYVVKGINMSIVTKKKTRLISRTIGNDEISVKLKVIY